VRPVVCHPSPLEIRAGIVAGRYIVLRNLRIRTKLFRGGSVYGLLFSEPLTFRGRREAFERPVFGIGAPLCS
jgi:hypothetical protein